MPQLFTLDPPMERAASPSRRGRAVVVRRVTVAAPFEGRELVYRTGELPFLLRVLAPLNARLHLPFALTSFVNAHGAQTVLLLIPLIAVLLPLMRVLPALYVWSVRRRLLHWYRALTALERSLDTPDAGVLLDAKRAELERIDAAVSRIRMPIYFADQLYDLRGHIDLVRSRLAARPLPIVMAAQ